MTTQPLSAFSSAAKTLCIAGVTGVLLLTTTAVEAALVGHFVSNDWAGAGTWNNRIAGFNDATIETGSPTLQAAGADATDGVFNFIDFGAGASSFNIGANPNSPISGLGDFTMTVVFRGNGVAQINGTDDRWWTQAGLFGAELPGGARADAGLTLDANGALLFGLADTRDYNQAQGGSVGNTGIHVASIRRTLSDGGNDATLELWLNGVMVDSTFLDNPGGDPFHTTQVLEDTEFGIGAQHPDSGSGDYHSFNGDIAEFQIHNDATIDVAALHNSLVQAGVYQVSVSTAPEPASAFLALLGFGLSICRRSSRRRV